MEKTKCDRCNAEIQSTKWVALKPENDEEWLKLCPACWSEAREEFMETNDAYMETYE